eukprot:SAG11_NODE_15086_length_589_cov_1.685714_1_plen_39_part_10
MLTLTDVFSKTEHGNVVFVAMVVVVVSLLLLLLLLISLP